MSGFGDADAAHWEAAEQIRDVRPHWVTIWSARSREYKAWPLFRAPRDTGASATTPEALTIQMDQIEEAARQRSQAGRLRSGTSPRTPANGPRNSDERQSATPSQS